MSTERHELVPDVSDAIASYCLPPIGKNSVGKSDALLLNLFRWNFYDVSDVSITHQCGEDVDIGELVPDCGLLHFKSDYRLKS